MHLYLNGLYWGLYNLAERSDENWLAAYNGGGEEDYVRVGSAPITPPPSWTAMLAELVDKGHVVDAAHYAAAATHLDMVGFADYMMVNQIALTRDWAGVELLHEHPPRRPDLPVAHARLGRRPVPGRQRRGARGIGCGCPRPPASTSPAAARTRAGSGNTCAPTAVPRAVRRPRPEAHRLRRRAVPSRQPGSLRGP